MTLCDIGSVASILAFGVSLFVLVRELKMAKEVHSLKIEEEEWHDRQADSGKGVTSTIRRSRFDDVA